MRFVVIGAGAWGTAFAVHLSQAGHSVVLAPRRSEQAAALEATRENADYLPGVTLPRGLAICADPGIASEGAEAAFVACPAQALRETAGRWRQALAAGAAPRPVVSLSKGLEAGTHLRPSQVLAAMLPSAVIGALAGPTNAEQVSRGLPAAMVLAASGPAAWTAGLQSAVSNRALRVYTSDDLPGVEFGGALKNIYAIAAGCADGLGLGDNAKSALLTRALAEMVRVGAALGARPETFYGLSGFGDLVATCHGTWSRNHEFGLQIGRGRSAADLASNRKTVVEGYRTTESFAGLCEERGIEAPILAEMRAILFSRRRPADALASLMMRGLKDEGGPAAPR